MLTDGKSSHERGNSEYRRRCDLLVQTCLVCFDFVFFVIFLQICFFFSPFRNQDGCDRWPGGAKPLTPSALAPFLSLRQRQFVLPTPPKNYKEYLRKNLRRFWWDSRNIAALFSPIKISAERSSCRSVHTNASPAEPRKPTELLFYQVLQFTRSGGVFVAEHLESSCRSCFCLFFFSSCAAVLRFLLPSLPSHGANKPLRVFVQPHGRNSDGAAQLLIFSFYYKVHLPRATRTIPVRRPQASRSPPHEKGVLSI